MKRVAIMTDNSAGITSREAEELGVSMVYIPFIIDGVEYSEDKNLTNELFFELLDNSKNLSTSQPSQQIIKDFWDSLLKEYDELVYIPLSSGLSGTCKASKISAQEYNGRVEVVDNKRVSVTLKTCLYKATNMAKEGKSAKEIREYLENNTYNSSIYISLSTLKYLKKGGRLSPAAAAIGTLLKIKPVLQIQGEKLDSYAKVMTMQQAKSKMLSAIEKDLETRFKDLYNNGEMGISVAYSGLDKNPAITFAEEVKSKFPNLQFDYINPLPLCISCHIGPDSLAVAIYRI